MDPVKILQRAWHILWSYRALWIFGLILALAAGSSSFNSGRNNSIQWREDGNDFQTPPPESIAEFFGNLREEIQRLFREGIPDANISGATLTTFLWVIGIFVVTMLIVGIAVAIARYVSETAVIRMVNNYENTGEKMGIRQGFRIGWSRTAWRLFLLQLIVHLPIILMVLLLMIASGLYYLSVTRGNADFNMASIAVMAGLALLTIFAGLVISMVLRLFRPFFWRVCVLEGTGVREALRRGFALVRENWKNVGLMWLIMIGLGIAWIFVSILAFIVTIPVVLFTAVIAVIVAGIPALLLVGIFSTFLTGPLPWIAAALFVLPLFVVIAFSPWLLLGSWQSVYTSTVWTLTYREIKALPALTPPATLEPVGD